MRGDDPTLPRYQRGTAREFPACAGMIRWMGLRLSFDRRVPRMRGDDPREDDPMTVNRQSSPHARG